MAWRNRSPAGNPFCAPAAVTRSQSCSTRPPPSAGWEAWQLLVAAISRFTYDPRNFLFSKSTSRQNGMSNFSHNSAETFYLQIKLIRCAYHCEKSTVMIAPNQVFGYGNLRKTDSYCWNISRTKDPSWNIFSKICRLHSIVWLIETNYSGKYFLINMSFTFHSLTNRNKL